MLSADLSFFGGLVQSLGTVELRFDAQNHFIHIGTPQAPLTTSFLSGMGRGPANSTRTSPARRRPSAPAGACPWTPATGASARCDGRAYLTIKGDLVVSIDQDLNPALQGALDAQGGADFGMQFSTFWNTYNVTIFSGNMQADMAFQAPGSPTLAGQVNVNYDVLGGLFSGSVGVDMEF